MNARHVVKYCRRHQEIKNVWNNLWPMCCERIWEVFFSIYVSPHLNYGFAAFALNAGLHCQSTLKLHAAVGIMTFTARQLSPVEERQDNSK